MNVNLLHLSSRKALESALTMARAFPHVNFRREVTVGHLLLDVDAPSASYAKVNPPIRPREDVEYLWRAVLEGPVGRCEAPRGLPRRAPGGSRGGALTAL